MIGILQFLGALVALLIAFGARRLLRMRFTYMKFTAFCAENVR